jgi:AcrR family transcriptional regulator
MTNSTPSIARQRILDTAADLFFREGYRSVGIDTIIEQSGVAKMTLYRHFPSKDDLIVAYLDQANQQFWDWFQKAIDPYPGQPRAQLLSVFEALAVLVNKPTCYGCPFLHAATEFPAFDHPGHAVALKHKRAVRQRLQELATEAGARQPELLAGQLHLLMDGTYVQARMFGPNNPALHVAQAAQELIDAQLVTVR